jgi:hypothetical protein
MGFLNPYMLVGLAGIAIPIAIHLLNRFRQRRMDWAAMELLRRAIVQRSREVKLEDILLLLLRCLAVIFLALALARPVIRSAAARWLGGKDTGVVLALDASYSMEHRPGVQQRFGRAQERAIEVLRTLPPSTPISIMILGDRPRVLLRHAPFDLEAASRVVKEAVALPERLNLDRCLEQVELLVRETRAAQREIYLVTDSQSATWGELSTRAREALQRIGRDSRLYLVDCSAGGLDNLAVTRLEHVSGLACKGMTGRFVAEVRNTGEQPQRNVELTLTVNDRAVDRRVLDALEPGARGAATFLVPFDAAGVVRLAVRLPPDALMTDNERFATVSLQDRLRVLVVEGPGGAGKDAADFISQAFAPPGMAAASRPGVDRVSWLGQSGPRLQNYQLTVLAGGGDPGVGQVRALEAYVRNGGNLLVFAGGNVADVQAFNRAMTLAAGKETNDMRAASTPPEGEGLLLPVKLLKRIHNTQAEAGRGWSVAPAAEHRLAHLLNLLPRPLLDELRLREAFQSEATAGSLTILKLAGTDFPLLTEKRLGGGKVLFCASAADRQGGNLPIHPLFPMLLNEILAYVAASPTDTGFLVGEPLAVSLPPRAVAESATFRAPAGRTEAVTVGASDADGRRTARFDEPTVPGFYEVSFSADAPPACVAVNVDPAESDVKPLTPQGLASAFMGVTIRAIGNGDDIAGIVREARTGKELWRWLLFLALAALVVEAWLATKFGRKAALKEAALPGRFRSKPLDTASSMEAP